MSHRKRKIEEYESDSETQLFNSDLETEILNLDSETEEYNSDSDTEKCNSDSETELSSSGSKTDLLESDEEIDNWCVEESDDDNAVNNKPPEESDYSSDESVTESSIPLSDRLDKFRKETEWTECDIFQPTVHPFVDSNAGIQQNSGLNSESTPLEILKKFYTPEMVEMICNETNKYAATKINVLRAAKKLKPRSRILKFKDIFPDEMYTFYGIVFLMGIIGKPSLEMYWSKNVMLETPFFSSVMTYDRFRQILSLLHFCENEDDSTDKISKIRPIYEALVANFKLVYRPGKDISIDESLVPWKGRLQFRQCNRSKRARFGIKVYKNCESNTGYVYDLMIYTGKDTSNKKIKNGIGISGEVVKKLLGDLGSQGRCLFIDNWYTSPLLCKKLVEEKTNVCGTVRINRKFMPKVNLKNLKPGEMKTMSTLKIAFIGWRDKKVVTMLTTMHNPTMVESGKINRRTGEEVMKPNVVISYNNNMGGVDQTDQSISSYEIIHKTVKWYQKLQFHLLDIAVFNASIVYNHLRQNEKKLTQLQFRQLLIKEIFEEHCQIKGKSKEYYSLQKNPAISTQCHYPSNVSDEKKIWKRCHLCYSKKIKKYTLIMCKECGKVPLCAVPCFREYHMRNAK